MSSLLAKNAFYLTFATVFQKILAFVYFTVLARFFGLEDTGDYFIALAVVIVIMVLDDLGVTSVLIRETAKVPAKAEEWLRAVIGVKLITMPITVVIAYWAPVVLGYDASITHLVRIAIVVMLADTLSLTFYGVLRGVQILRYESIGMFAGQVFTAVFGFTAMALGVATLEILIFALICGSVWNLLFSAFIVWRRLGSQAFVPSYSMGFLPLKMAFAFFLAAAFVKVYSYIDTIILSKLLGSAAVGAYAVAYKFTYAFQFIPLAFVGALYPALSAQVRDKTNVKHTLLQSFWYLMLIGAPIVFGLWSVAPEVILFFYGNEFVSSIIVLQVLVFVLVPIFLDFPLGSLLNASDRQMMKTVIGGFTMLLNIGFNLLFIPIFGPMGAALAALISFTFMFVADWIALRGQLSIRLSELFSTIGPILLLSMSMAAFVFVLKMYVHFAFAVFAGVVFYAVGALVFGIVQKKHLLFFAGFFKKSVPVTAVE